VGREGQVLLPESPVNGGFLPPLPPAGEVGRGLTAKTNEKAAENSAASCFLKGKEGILTPLLAFYDDNAS